MRYPAVCLAFVVVWSVIWGIEPRYRSVWLSENVLTAIMIPLMIYIHRRIGLSNLAYTMVALFTAVHIVGSHYSYGEVPLGDWAKDAFGYTRNHYDRLVHFFFGFCLAIPLRELFTRGLKIRHLGA
ncbi:MAG: DUF2238 domain-containing protein, partial [Planctomycetota bacterium]|nr:DUF2238 domain-containing protein [Planctomycetota bacterium]